MGFIIRRQTATASNTKRKRKLFTIIFQNIKPATIHNIKLETFQSWPLPNPEIPPST